MGQSQSAPPAPATAASKAARLFLSLSKSISPLSLADYNSTFSSLAEQTSPSSADAAAEPPTFWKEDTLARFLEVPAKIGSLLFKSASYLAALPTLENVPAPLDRDGLFIATMVFTQRIPGEVLSSRELNRLLFNSFAELPPRKPGTPKEDNKEVKEEKGDGKEESKGYGPQIPVSTMIELILFLLSITTPRPLLTPTDIISHTSPTNRSSAAKIAHAMINAMQSYTKRPHDGIPYDAFRAFIEHDAPYFFDPLAPLFSNLLYDRGKWGDEGGGREDWVGALEGEQESELMNLVRLAQISEFFPKNRRVGKMVWLYAGSRDGFSMGMFESKVLKYPGPTILILRGTVERDKKEVVLGAYISTPWKSSSKENFGDTNCMLFQLSPTHAVYKATPYHTQLVYFSPRLGLGFGVPPPQPTRRQSFSAQTLIQHTTDPQVSLSLDPSLELASFTHSAPGGTFAASVGTGTGLGMGEFQWRVEIAEVEVWGCGVEDAREEQRRAWEWERREAERRQNIRVREDLAGDRALLEMAGLIGGNRSGGSV